ncbi:hypothetical protein ACJMK2_020339 [Sinanodonta woodiana]|uniref:Uncharacterized protein n=1 Tax=Sinanodonta woodiana TaxID=1069815 RepID=A0ABD3TYS1_SINWO
MRVNRPFCNIYTCRHEILNEVADYLVRRLSLICSKWPWSRVMDTRATGIDHLVVFQHGELYSESVYEEISLARQSLLHAKRMAIVSVCTDEDSFEHDETCKMERVYSMDGIFLFEFHIYPLTSEAHSCTANILTKLHTFWLPLKTPGAERKFYINPFRVKCICVEEGLTNVRSAFFRTMRRHFKCGSWHDIIVGKYGNDAFRMLMRFGQMPSADQRKVIEKRLPEAQYTIFISACVKGDVHQHVKACKYSSIRVDHKQFTYFEIHILRGFQNDVIIPRCQTNITTIQDLQGMFGMPKLPKFRIKADEVRCVSYNETLKGALSLLCQNLHIEEKRRSWLTTVGRKGRDWNLLIMLPGHIPRADEMSRLEKKVVYARCAVFIYVCDKTGKLINTDIERATSFLSLEEQLNSAVKAHEDACSESLVSYAKDQYMYFEVHAIDGIDALPNCKANHRALEKMKHIFVVPKQVHNQHMGNYVDTVVKASSVDPIGIVESQN